MNKNVESLKLEDLLEFGLVIECLDINSRGSGFIINNNLIGTNWHVIHDSQGNQSNDVVARNKEGKQFNCIVKESDSQKDFVILQINEQFNLSIDFGDFEQQKVFEEVYFVGKGLDVPTISLHRGWISAKTQVDNINVFQVDGPINQGNSGGPLFNKEGKIIAIITRTEAIFDKDLQGLLRLIPQLQGSVAIFGINLAETLRKIIFYLDRNRHVGIGYAFSIEYLVESYKNARYI